MPKLIVNPDSPEAWEVELQPGVNSLGRGEENDFQIEHPSVGAAHCAVTVQDSGVVITDQGSIPGTFVDGALVEEATLRSGQVIKLGEVTLRFQNDTAQSGATFPPRAGRKLSLQISPQSAGELSLPGVWCSALRTVCHHPHGGGASGEILSHLWQRMRVAV
jgi:pSer/pThr/pTyr-binding forkhead associated (FHA) protein